MDKKVKEFIKRLKTLPNYAKDHKVSKQYIYRIAKEGKLNTIEIDGVPFVYSGSEPGSKKSKKEKPESKPGSDGFKVL